MYQQVTVVGNLGREPEMRYTPSGQPVTSFSVATNRKYKGIDETTWFSVTAWGKLAETVHQYLHKGNKVLVVGRLVPDKNGGPRVWEGSDGQPRASFEVNADTVRFLETRSDGSTEEDFSSGTPSGGDDIPF